MITLVFGWGAAGLLMGLTGGSHDVTVAGLILVGMGVVMFFAQTTYWACVRNANASEMLRATETRRRDGGAL